MSVLFAWAWKRAIGGRPIALTWVFWIWIPFNRPHRFRIKKLEKGAAVVFSPNRSANRNHLGTQHACALATVGEFAAGLALLGAFRPTEYRLIMSRMEVEYSRRAVGGIQATARLNAAELASIESALRSEGRTEYLVETDLVDDQGEGVACVRTRWQIKSWGQIQS